jgi:hypothetical protein
VVVPACEDRARRQRLEADDEEWPTPAEAAMDLRFHLPLEELVRLERLEKDAAQSKRLRIVILAIGGWTAPAIAMSVGLTRRICQGWVYRYNEQSSSGGLSAARSGGNA